MTPGEGERGERGGERGREGERGGEGGREGERGGREWHLARGKGGEEGRGEVLLSSPHAHMSTASP